MAAPDLDPATLDIASPEHFERNGYPHPEWTWLRRHAPVFWYERPNVEPFWAITKHADIIEISKQPEIFLNAPRLAVLPAAARRPLRGSLQPAPRHALRRARAGAAASPSGPSLARPGRLDRS